MNLVFALAAAALFGLQALLERFEWLYLGLRIAGGLYLVWIGIQLFRHAGKGDATAVAAAGAADANQKSAALRPRRPPS